MSHNAPPPLIEGAPPPIIEGDEHNRQYIDAHGKPLRVGDMILYITSMSSSVYLNYGKIAKFTPGKRPGYLGLTPDGRRVESWDTSFSLTVIPYDFDRFTQEFSIPSTWGRVNGNYQPIEQTEDEVKRRSIKAVERVIRMDSHV